MRIMIFAHPIRLAVALLLCIVGMPAAAAVTGSYTAKYHISYGAISLGDITFSLAAGDTPDCYVFSGTGSPNLVVSMLVGDLAEESRFCMTAAGQVRPYYFQHYEKGDAEHSYSLQFDWADQQVDYRNFEDRTQTNSLPAAATDPLSLQIAVRQWIDNTSNPPALDNRDFTLASKDKIKTYTLAVEDGGTIQVPGGSFDTVIVQRVDDTDKGMRFWLAEDADWIPVKVERQRSGRTITMELTSLERE